MTMYANETRPILKLGRQVVTSRAITALESARYDWQWYVAQLLYKHARGDWGNVCPEDKTSNDEAARNGGRVISSYKVDPFGSDSGHGSNALWVITEADRSTTTVLLAEEY